MPVVTVVVPAYNASQYIRMTLDSIRQQTFRDMEVLVIDDGSRDDTAALVEREYPEMTCLRKTNGGASSARNHGLARASGEFIAFLDADDVWHPQKIEAQVALMRAYPQAMLCRTQLTESPLPANDRQDLSVQNGLPAHRLVTDFFDSYHHPYFATSTVMVRRQAIEQWGVFDTKLKVAEDVDFYLRIIVNAVQVPFLSFPAIFKRPVKGSLGDDSEPGYVQLIAVYEQFHAQHPQASQLISTGMRRKTSADLWARLAASQRHTGKRGPALRSACRSFAIYPNLLAMKVALLALTRRN